MRRAQYEPSIPPKFKTAKLISVSDLNDIFGIPVADNTCRLSTTHIRREPKSSVDMTKQDTNRLIDDLCRFESVKSEHENELRRLTSVIDNLNYDIKEARDKLYKVSAHKQFYKQYASHPFIHSFEVAYDKCRQKDGWIVLMTKTDKFELIIKQIAAHDDDTMCVSLLRNLFEFIVNHPDFTDEK